MPNTEVSVSSAISYKGIFDKSIYNQDYYLNGRPEEHITEIDLLSCLINNKRDRLRKVILDNMDALMCKYESILAQGTGKLNRIHPWAQTLAGMLPFTAGIERMTMEVSREEAQKEMLKLTAQAALLLSGLDKEPIFELEKKYVLMKRHIKSKEMEDQIEKALLLCREEGVFLELLGKFINNCLAMPISWYKIAPPILHVPRDDFFNNFNPNLLNKLGEIVTKLSFDSTQPDIIRRDRPTGSRRCVYYFHGDPGTGKSQSAKFIAELCGIPHFVFSVKTIEDLSSQALEGSPRTYNAEEPGLLAKALMSKNKAGKSCKNTILILEDFDRVLFPSAENKESNIPAALCFLLDYLDPEKKDYYNRYFQSTIDISGLSIFITANQPIPENINYASRIKTFDPYAALRSRVSEIYFANFSEETLKNMLIPYAQSICRKYNLQASTENCVQCISEAIKIQKNYSSILEPRDLKRQVERVVIASKRNVSLESVYEKSKPRQSICTQYLNAIKNDKALQSKLAIAALGVGILSASMFGATKYKAKLY